MKQLTEIWSKHKAMIVLTAVVVGVVIIYRNSNKSNATANAVPPAPPITPVV